MARNNCCGTGRFNLNCILSRRPDAMAEIIGSSDYPEISGTVRFFKTDSGVLIVTEVSGLPKSDDICNGSVFGYHIHSGNKCMGNKEDAFADAMTHFNPYECEHPYHAGDMPPLFGNNGYAFSIVLSDRFSICDIIGRTVIIHLHPDDFHSQPAGNAGTKIACGRIQRA